MSKIQDALKRIQGEKSGATPKAKPPTPIARVAEHDETMEVPRLHHEYGGPVIEVDRVALREEGLLAAIAEQRRIADQYRQIKRPIIANARGKGVTEVPRGNLLMVASAIPGEGKTFSCINLCLSIAMEKDWSVVLVDGDCAKPHISNLFGVADRPGLMDVLRTSLASFDEYVMPTDIPNLAILPAGQADEYASELLSSDRMDRLCEKLSEGDANRIVIFDSSPLLYTTEAPILAGHVGQVALVVAADRTEQGLVLNAIEKLDDQKAINLILNKAGMLQEMSGDYYGYGYGTSGSAESS